MRVLLVDDSPSIRHSCTMALGRMFEVATAATVDEALAALQGDAVDVIIADLDLGDRSSRDGVWLLKQVANAWPDTRRVLFSGFDEDGIADKAADPAVHMFVRKPGGMGALVAAIRG